MSTDLERQFKTLSALVKKDGTPNINDIWDLAKDIEHIKLNIKFFGYEIARQLAEKLPPATGLSPRHVGLASKPSTQRDLESDWAAYWCAEIRAGRFYHRKLWELAYVLQAFYENDMVKPGRRGLGFGCGIEPIPSYLAAKGVQTVVTDLPPEEGVRTGWQNTNQFAATREHIYRAHLVSRELFDANVALEYVDMNAIPATLQGFDFCWSICALEHLGSIEKGLAFIENSVNTLKPGGVAVHTTEFNYANDDETIDNWPTVLFQKKHFIELKTRLERRGHTVAPLDFDVGSQILDRFIDLPPFLHNMTPDQKAAWGGANNHIKVAIDGFASTCFGLIITRGK